MVVLLPTITIARHFYRLNYFIIYNILLYITVLNHQNNSLFYLLKNPVFEYSLNISRKCIIHCLA